MTTKATTKAAAGGLEEEEVGRHLLQVRGETYRATELGWRNLVFVPFNTYWLIVITSTAIIQQFLDNYHQVFKHPQSNFYILFTTISWIIFVVDPILSIIHRLWERVNRSRRFVPKSWNVIFVDMICAHPILLIHFVYFQYETLSLILKTILIVVDIIRLYRVLIFYEFLKAKIGLNQLLVHTIFYILFVVIIADLFSILCAVVEARTKDLTLIEQFVDNKFVKIHLFLFHLLLGSAVNKYIPSTLFDVVLLLFPTLIWYCLNRVFVIILLMDFLKRLNHHFYYRSTLEVAEIHLTNIGVKKGVKEDFLDFYDTLWELWWGIKWEESLEQLPLSMRKETLVDISWDAIQHSRSLRFQGINFKRDIALKIQSVMYRPGDYVFEFNETKSNMFYLVSGTLQVMSAHDNTCPLISFSRGTIMGGGSIIVPTASNLAVRSSSYSEMHILRCSQLFDVALAYPWEVKYLHLRAFDRLQDAYTMRKVELLFQTRKKMYDEIFVEPEIKCITWMKKRWKLINSLDVNTYAEAKEVVKDIPVYEQFTSRYLDLYVISEDLDLKKNRFCLEAMWPFVMEPDCDFLKFWNSFILVLVLGDSLVLPYYAAFTLHLPYFIEHASIFNQLMFMFDTYFHLITAVKTKDGVIVTAKEIVKYRLKRLEFVVDLVSAFPIGILNRLLSVKGKSVIYWDLLRLFKTWRVLKNMLIMENNIKNPATVPWVRHLVVYMFLIYWSSCFMYMLSCPTLIQCNSEGWVDQGQEYLRNRRSGQDTRCYSSFLAISLYYVMTVLHQMQSSNIGTSSLGEWIAICILTAVVQTYVIYFTAHVIAVDLLSDSLHISFSSLIKNTSNIMKSRNLPKNILADLLEYLNLQWSHDRAQEFLLQRKLFHDAPEKLNKEITNYFKDVLRSYKIFQGDSENTKYMIDKLSEKARIVMLPPHFVVCYGGSRPNCLTILRKGYCRMVSHLKEDLAKFPDGKLVGAGAIFPLIEVLSKTMCCVTVYTETNCECIVFDEPDFIKAWETSENDKFETAKASPQIETIIRNTIEELEPNFRPIISNTRETSFIYRKPFFCDKSNLFRVILHLCFPKYCLSPLGSFLFYWELSRFILIPITVNFFVLYYVLLYALYPRISLWISTSFDIISLIDVLIRFNTGYYNKDGVFMADTCLVVYNYLVTSFMIDFIGAFPWQILFHVKKVVDLPWLMLALFKSFPLYRVIRFDLILAKRGTFRMSAHIYTFSIFFITFINLLLCTNLLYMCFVEYENNHYNRVYCKQQLIISPEFDNEKIQDMLLMNLGAIIGVTLKMKSRIEQAFDPFEMMLCTAYTVASNLLQILFVVKCCRWAKSGLKDYTLFKQNVDTLDIYLKRNMHDIKFRHSVKNHFKYFWDNRMPEEISNMLTKVHPTLRGRVLFYLYFEKLRLVSFLKEARDYLLRALAQEVKEMYVLKGQSIIEEFEISKSVYLIWNGEVVVTVGKISPVVLGRGCIFGCLTHTGFTKHVFSFEAMKNCGLLKIESQRFYSVLKEQPEIYHTFIRLGLPSREYIITGEEITITSSSIDLSEVDLSAMTTTSSSNYVLIYLLVTYFVSYMTVVLLCLIFVFGATSELIYCLLIVDLLTLWKIFTQFSLPYIDPNSGFTVKNKRLIRMRYIKSIDFYIDIITFIPYLGLKWLLLIKLLRCYQVMKAVYQRKSSFLFRNWEVWAHAGLLFILMLFLLSILWTLAVGKTMTIYNKEEHNIEAIRLFSKEEMFINSLLFTATLMTQTGRIINIQFPTNKTEISLAVVISFTSLIILGIFHGQISHFVEKVTWAKRHYENKMQRQWQYLKLRELSQCILETVWEHGELLWHYNRGQYLPSALHVLPYPLKKRTMHALFGRHLENSYLFKHTHIEFIKNLCARLELRVFFPGESIVVEGDVNGTMYFIHSGEIDVLKKTGKDEESLVGILTVGQVFGFCQGLYECRPHPHSYKARSTCEVLLLRRQDWLDLMLFYDAQTLTVYKRAAKLPYEFEIDHSY